MRICDEPMDTEYGFAYGIEVHRRDGIAHLGHGGGMPGYEAFVLIDTDHGLGVTLVSTKPSIGVRDLAWTKGLVVSLAGGE